MNLKLCHVLAGKTRRTFESEDEAGIDFSPVIRIAQFRKDHLACRYGLPGQGLGDHYRTGTRQAKHSDAGTTGA
uniref:Uncharacterized protein n=1 Tax=Aquisalinus luteolus TaxID=1566827 RepID=A0A8J3A272_9PROT|nr:hypothetical protein GCM10011355_18920 [Aquisalinus luteolus]